MNESMIPKIPCVTLKNRPTGFTYCVFGFVFAKVTYWISEFDLLDLFQRKNQKEGE